jgi:Ca2+-transporting ATPase
MTVVTLELACGAVRVEGTGLAPEGAFRLDGRVVDPEALPPLAAALDVGVLCNNASYDAAAAAGTGDPMELALLVAGTKGGRDRDALRAARPELAEHAFDPETRRMATLHRDGDGILAAVKGAPESLLPCCSTVLDAQGPRPLDAEARADWLRRADALAARGERVLVVARQRPPSVDAFAFRELELLGLVGFLDPPRPTVPAAVAACDAAGVRLVMVTGDHGATAWSIAGAVGLVPDRDAVEGDWEDARVLGSVAGLDGDARARLLERRVVARATPEQKLDLIRLHQAAGHVVAMTGDGVNDAPALRQADIGIAMGKRGTQVAREAAAMVLRDDELGSIVVAIAEGRAIFANIRKFVVYLMSCNVSEILAVGVAAVAMGPLPLLPLQILFLNLVTDVFPALALGVCRGHPGLMDRPPRPRGEAVLTAAQWRAIAGYGASIAVTVLAMLVIASQLLGVSDAEATTLTFTTLALAQLWHVFTMRDEASGLLRNEVTGNGWVWAAIGLCLALVALALGWTPLATILGLEPPSEGLGLAVLLSFVPAVLGQAGIAFRSRRKLRRASA